jgi:hypothetical protein
VINDVVTGIGPDIDSKGEVGLRLHGDPARGRDVAWPLAATPACQWVRKKPISLLSASHQPRNNRCRRLAKDWENLNRNALAFLRLASIRLMLRKLCNPA